MFDFSEKALNQMAFFIDIFIIKAAYFTISFGGGITGMHALAWIQFMKAWLS